MDNRVGRARPRLAAVGWALMAWTGAWLAAGQSRAAAASEPAAAAGFSIVKSLGGIDEYQLDSNGLTLAEVYPTRGGKKAAGQKGSVAPKYRHPADPTKTWSGRGKQPLWFAEAIKKRGVTAESLLIGGAATKTPTKVAKKATKKAVNKVAPKKKTAKV